MDKTMNALDQLIDRYCLIENGAIVGDMHATALTRCPETRLKDFLAARMQQVDVGEESVNLGRAWQSSSSTIRLRDKIYLPGADRVIEHGDYQCWNAYAKPVHPKAAASGGEFMRHIEHIIPDTLHRRVFLDWLAFKIQNPDKRSFAIVMVADSPIGNSYGIGRSMVGVTIRRLLQQGVVNLELDDIVGNQGQSQFNEWQALAQIVVVEETKEQVGDYKSNTDHYEQLKKMVDMNIGEGARIKTKYGGITTADVYANYLFFTNHYDALKIPDADRRFYVLDNATEKRAKADYARLAAFNNDPKATAGLFSLLMARDLSNFDHTEPPMTEAKDRMQELGVSAPEELVNEALADFSGALVTKRQMINQINIFCADSNESESIKAIARSKMNCIWKRLSKLQPSDKKNGGRINKESVRILRDVDYWTLSGPLGWENEGGKHEMSAKLRDELAKNNRAEPPTDINQYRKY